MHNEGYSTMCGHAVIALARYAVDQRRLINPARLDSDDAEIPVTIQCPCGPITAFVQRRPDRSTTGTVRFYSIPAFAFALGQFERLYYIRQVNGVNLADRPIMFSLLCICVCTCVGGQQYIWR